MDHEIIHLREATDAECAISTQTAAWLNELDFAQALPLRNGRFLVNPGNVCGLLGNGEITFEIEPKASMRELLELTLYARTGLKWSPTEALAEQREVPVVIAGYLVQVTRNALDRGILRGYRNHQETLRHLRGRLRMTDQLTRRFMQVQPIEVEYTDLTSDILENQILAAAIERMMRVLGSEVEKSGERDEMIGQLRSLRSLLGHQSPLSNTHAHRTWRRTDQNKHYWEALSVAELVLDGGGRSLKAGQHTTTSLLIQTWRIYETAVARALRESMRFRTVEAQYVEYLATNRTDRTIRPDIVAQYHDGRLLVLDTKFKDKEPQPNDLYQAVTYSRVLGVKEVVLLYAGDHETVTYNIRQRNQPTRCDIVVEYLNLDQSVDDIVADVHALADKYGADK